MRSIWLLGFALGACDADPVDDGPTCDPARGATMAVFADVTERSGLAFDYVSNTFKGGGLAVVDLDGDGRADIVAGKRDGGVQVFANRGANRFEELSATGIDPTLAATAIAAVDLDNDDDRDLVIAGANTAHILENLGDGTFREAARLDDSGSTEHVLPVDLDGDGRLDLYFSNYDLTVSARTQNRVYLNRGALQFAFARTAGTGLSWTTTAFDIDADGDQDLYVANDTLLPDFGRPAPMETWTWPVDLVLRNDGLDADGVPQFTDLAAELGLDQPRSSMGGLLGDFDTDGRLDLFIPDYGAKKLFLRDPAGGFVERAVAFGLDATMRANERCDATSASEDCLILSWSAVLADFDLDGYDELLMVNGETSPGDVPPVLMFARGAETQFREVAPSIPCMDARGLVVNDLDGDGDEDVVVAQREGPLQIYENRGRPAAGSWLRVELRGRASNREGVGAVVTLRMASGRSQVRVVGAGGVIHSASPAEAFFGLGSDEVTAVEVRWPSGRQSTVSRPSSGMTLVLDEGL